MRTLFKVETIPFLGNASLHLCLRTPPKGIPLEQVPDPFIHVSRTDPTGRWFVGMLKTDMGEPLFPFCLRILKDTIDSGDDDSITNVKIEKLWRQEHALSKRIEGYRSSIYGFSLFEDECGEIRKNPPLLFCKRKRLFFSPVCPYCGRPLTECREDDLLVDVSLKPYSSSSRRYLYCPDCSPEGTFRPAFFAKEVIESERSNPLVADRYGLVGLWSRLELTQSEGGRFPCAVCDSFEKCFPKDGQIGESVKLLYPFSFYDFFGSVRRFSPYSLEHVADLVSGMPVEELEESMKAARDEIGIRTAYNLRWLAKIRSRYFSTAVPEPRVSVSEVFILKMNLYRQILGLVISAWGVTKAPLVCINPETFSVSLLEDNPVVPVFWELKIEPSFLTSILYEHFGTESSTNEERERIVPAPLFSLRPEYLKIDPKSIGKKVYGNLLIDKCELVDSETKVKVWGSIQYTGSQSFLEESSFIKVNLGFEQGFSRNLSVVFKVESVSSGKANIVSMPLSVGVDEIQQFQILASQPPFEVTFHFLPSFTISSDLYSMGILGLRLFLCNRKVTLEDILSTIEGFKSDIKQRLSHPETAATWQQVFNGGNEELFDVRNLFYDGMDTKDVILDLDSGLWDRFLTSLFKMIFSSAGNGYLESEDVRDVDVWNSVFKDLEDISGLVLTHRMPGSEEATIPAKEKDVGRKKSEIGKILQALLNDLSWLEPEKKEPPAKETEIDIPTPLEIPATGEKRETEAVSKVPEVDMDKPPVDETVTVTLSSGKQEEMVLPPIPKVDEKPSVEPDIGEFDDLEKTVVLPSSRKRKKAIKTSTPRKNILGPEEQFDKEQKKKKLDDEVFLDETIVIRKKPKKE